MMRCFGVGNCVPGGRRDRRRLRPPLGAGVARRLLAFLARVLALARRPLGPEPFELEPPGRRRRPNRRPRPSPRPPSRCCVVATALVRVGEHVPRLVELGGVGLAGVARGVEPVLADAVRTADVVDRRVRVDTEQRVVVVHQQATPRRSRSSPTRRSSGTRSCAIESRSRTVTARSSSVSKSIVTHNGVPISS